MLSACSARYDFTECESQAECSRFERIDPSNPNNNELFACQENRCVVISDQCRADLQCGGGMECNDGECEPVMDPDAGDTGDAEDTSMDTDMPDTTDTQEEETIDNSCSTTQECLDSPDFGEGYACSTDGTCEETTCSDTPVCTDTFGEDFACNADGACVTMNCETTTYCNENFSENHYCPGSGKCVDTTLDICEDLFYPAGANRDDVVVLGTIIPTQVQGYESVGPTIRNGARMAVIEYGNAAVDLPGGQAVAHLQCEGGTTENALNAAEHLRAIEVPTIVGPLTSDTYINAVSNVTGDVDDNPVVTISMSATSPSIEALTAAGTYSFQLIANDRFQSSAIADRAKQLNQRSCTEVTENECTSGAECQATFGADWTFDSQSVNEPCVDSAPKVVAFYKDDKYGNDLQSLTASRFQDRYPGATIEFYQYATPADLNFDADQIAVEFGSVITSSLSGGTALPDADIALFIGTGEAIQLAGSYISALSNQGLEPQKRQYLFSHGSAADTPQVLAGFQTPDPFLGRIEAVAPNVFNTTDQLFESWQGRYSTIFNEPAQTTVGGLAYDSAFVSIFAMAAASAEGDVTAESVSQVLQAGTLQDSAGQQVQLKEVTTFPVDAKLALGRGNTIDMVGVSGDLDFVFQNDQNLGIIRSDYLGLDATVRDTPQGPVYEGVPARIYLLTPGESFGTWANL